MTELEVAESWSPTPPVSQGPWSLLQSLWSLLRGLWPDGNRGGMHIDTENALDEISREVERRVTSAYPPGHGPEALLVRLTDRVQRPALARLLTGDDFGSRLHAALRMELGAAAPTRIFVDYKVGESAGVEVITELPPSDPCTLLVDATPWHPAHPTERIRVGRGQARSRLRGAHNDLVIPDSYPFVKRDAFELVWDPGHAVWALHVDHEARAQLRLEREGVRRMLQRSRMALRDGDVIVLVGGPGNALHITFHQQKASS